MDLSEYQKQAHKTAQADKDPLGASIAALGLVSEAGSLANVVKKYLRDNISWEGQRDFLIEEIGDVLWYLADVATRMKIDLSSAAEKNLLRTQDRFGQKGEELPDLLMLDHEYPPDERFPRRIKFHFAEKSREKDGRALVVMKVISAEPNLFPQGPVVDPTTQKTKGFAIGDPLSDNSHREDGYRYHDAFHIGLMAVLGWSPVMRALLKLKRRSKPDVDENQDGRRAGDVEEGLSTYLFMRSRKFGNFQRPENVGNDILDDVVVHTENLEVQRHPTRLWRRAISEGYKALELLSSNQGGYVTADLDARTVTYEKF